MTQEHTRLYRLEQVILTPVEHASEILLLAHNGAIILCDVDGVLADLKNPLTTTPASNNLDEQLAVFTTVVSPISFLTARNEENTIRHYNTRGVKLNGQSIFEGGQLVSHNGTNRHIPEEAHRIMLQALRHTIQRLPSTRGNWTDVKHGSSVERPLYYLAPDHFQGLNRLSIWTKRLPGEGDYHALVELIQQEVHLMQLEVPGFTYDNLNICSNLAGDLRYTVISGKDRNGTPFHKGSAINLLDKRARYIVIADGDGDLGFVKELQKQQIQHHIIAIGGHTNPSDEVVAFHKYATQSGVMLANPLQLEKAMALTIEKVNNARLTTYSDAIF